MAKSAGSEQFVAMETAGVKFGDPRLGARLRRILKAAAASPSSSFPEMSDSSAELEGTYRFLSNERVTAKAILAPHLRATASRVAAAGRVIVAHDSTQFSFGPVARGDLEPVGHGKSYGFDAHVSLAVTADESRTPLGVLALAAVNRKFGAAKVGHRKDDPDNIMHRWAAQVQQVRRQLGDSAEIVHVMDREADDYALLAALVENDERFVIRQSTDRRTVKHRAEPKTRDALAQAPLIATREVIISAKRKPTRKTHASRTPVRENRTAVLEIRAAKVTLPRTDGAGGRGPATLSLNLIEAIEHDPPTGQEPIQWWLYTNEPIDSDVDVLAAIDAYRGRWVVEEYFKALKTGCRFEQRQLETRHALQNALAVFASVAWRLLLLRSLSRDAPNEPATLVLTELQIRALRGFLQIKQKTRLPARLRIREAMLAVAKVGGHIANNGDPGWLVLGRGLDRLLDIELGLSLAKHL